MNRFAAHNHVPEVRRTLVDIVRVCKELGIERSKTELGKWTCPRHGGGSLSVRIGHDRTIQVRCFGCDLTGDVFTLIAEARGLSVSRDFPAVLSEGARIGGLWGVLAELEDRSKQGPCAPRRPGLALHRDPAVASSGSPDQPNLEKNGETPLTSGRPNVQPSERPYPPEHEVQALWAACTPVSTLDLVREALKRRSLEPATVAGLDLARALPDGLQLPRWASYRGNARESRSWLELGYRLVIPVYDDRGHMRSVRAWRVGDDNDGPKRLPPSGYRASALVMADTTARTLLQWSRWPSGMVGRVVIVEGEPDFLTWATRFSDNAQAVHAVLGITSGSWTEELAARIPNGARIVVRTHHDQAGNAYAARIGATLTGRCTVLRSKGTTI